jgi:PAS domain S-box-containing protein
MNQKKIVLALDDQLGTSSPFWRFSASSDDLVLCSEDGCVLTKIRLNPVQIAKIQNLTGTTSTLLLDVRLFDRQLQLHLIGKKINAIEWAGVAAALSDSESVARNFTQALTFAEQIVSTVNSVVVVVNKLGDIQRFNQLAEEYTGQKEKDVVGMNVQELFMSPSEGKASRENIVGFFDQDKSLDVERVVKTVKGSRLFLFRNRFAPSVGWTDEKLLVCSGIDITDIRDDRPFIGENRSFSKRTESYFIDVMNRVMNWASLVDGARALLACFDNGEGDRSTLAHAKRIAAQAVSDAYALHEELDTSLPVSTTSDQPRGAAMYAQVPLRTRASPVERSDEISERRLTEISQ